MHVCMLTHVHMLLHALPYQVFFFHFLDISSLSQPLLLVKSILEAISHKRITYYHIFFIAILLLFITIFFVSAYTHLHFYVIAAAAYTQYSGSLQILYYALLVLLYSLPTVILIGFTYSFEWLHHNSLYYSSTVGHLDGFSISLLYIVLWWTFLCLWLYLSFIPFLWARVPQVGLSGENIYTFYFGSSWYLRSNCFSKCFLNLHDLSQ